MNDTVDDTSIADGSELSSGPSSLDDETQSLPNAVASPPHSPRSFRVTAPRSTLDTTMPDQGSIQPTNNDVAGEVDRIDPRDASASQILRHRGPTVGQRSSSRPGAESDPSKQPWETKSIRTRFKFPALEQSDFYTPPVSISNPLLTKKLIKIAQEFSFLDSFFADLFRLSKGSHDSNDLQQCLLDIKSVLAKRQRQSSRENNNQAVQIGSLGEWCEYICTKSPMVLAMSKTTYTNDLRYSEDYLVYLQGTLEVPYWQLVIDLLLDWRNTRFKCFGDGMLYMLRYKALYCRNRVEELDQIDALGTKDQGALAIMKQSIQKRLDVLNTALEVKMLDEDLDLKTAANQRASGVHSEQEPGTHAAVLQPTSDAPVQLVLFVFFIILAFIPGYQGFAISAQSDETGATSDADFYYLMQSSIMSVLGNFATALPLLQSGRITGPSHFFWVFSALGLFSAVLAVVIYPLANTRWSSVVSFVGNVASAASVLVLTIATASERIIGPRSRFHGNHVTKNNAELDEKKNQ